MPQRKTENVSGAYEEVALKVNTVKSEYTFISCYQNGAEENK
jgi:hypothetical protein